MALLFLRSGTVIGVHSGVERWFNTWVWAGKITLRSDSFFFACLFSSGNSMLPLLQYWLKKNARRFLRLWVWVVQEVIFFPLVFVPTEPLTCFPENLGIFFQHNSSSSGRTRPIISLKMSPTSQKRILLNRVLQNFVVQSLSCVWLCDPMDCSTPGFPVLHYLLEFSQIVHWVSDIIQPSRLLCLLHLLPSIFPRIRVFSNELALHIR